MSLITPTVIYHFVSVPLALIALLHYLNILMKAFVAHITQDTLVSKEFIKYPVEEINLYVHATFQKMKTFKQCSNLLFGTFRQRIHMLFSAYQPFSLWNMGILLIFLICGASNTPAFILYNLRHEMPCICTWSIYSC